MAAAAAHRRATSSTCAASPDQGDPTMKQLLAVLLAVRRRSRSAGCNTDRGHRQGHPEGRRARSRRPPPTPRRRCRTPWKPSPCTRGWSRRWTAPTSTPTRSSPSSS
ncbi:MAG: hypothetical protein MZW92_73885 [Comamonadaceae bacterium]|nr:hypothetical protein [Comamonadaceae bacterium]